MRNVALLVLLAWYFAVGREVIGPFDSRVRCQAQAIRASQAVADCYCVLMFPTDCNDLVAYAE